MSSVDHPNDAVEPGEVCGNVPVFKFAGRLDAMARVREVVLPWGSDFLPVERAARGAEPTSPLGESPSPRAGTANSHSALRSRQRTQASELATLGTMQRAFARTHAAQDRLRDIFVSGSLERQ